MQLPNPSGLVGQKSGPETNLRAALAGGNEKRVFFVRYGEKEKSRWQSDGRGSGNDAGSHLTVATTKLERF